MAYVNKCRELYQIAFFQWRKMYPTDKIYHEDEVIELINDRMEYTFMRNKDMMEDENRLKISQMTQHNSKLPKDFYFTYFASLFLNKEEIVDCSYNITSFEQLGWKDPYPNENRIKAKWKNPEKIDDLVYKKARFQNNFIPQVVYVPRKDIMFKIMRACIEVKSEQDFWFNNKY